MLAGYPIASAPEASAASGAVTVAYPSADADVTGSVNVPGAGGD
jgi:hypothetical protein